MTLLPREHGAYGQMAFPLATALVIAGINTAAAAWMVAVVAALAAHEPVFILLGRRGGRLRRERGRSAAVAAALCIAVATIGGLVAFTSAAPAVRWSFAAPLVPAAFIVVASVKGLEKSWPGETAVALAFSLAAIPAAMIAGATMETASTVAVAFCSIFVAGTLAVRVVVLGVRGGGNPRAVSATRAAVIGVTVLAIGGLALAVMADLLPVAPLAAVAPALLLSVATASYPPRATRLRAMGWSLLAATTVAAAVLIAGLRAA